LFSLTGLEQSSNQRKPTVVLYRFAGLKRGFNDKNNNSGGDEGRVVPPETPRRAFFEEK